MNELDYIGTLNSFLSTLRLYQIIFIEDLRNPVNLCLKPHALMFREKPVIRLSVKYRNRSATMLIGSTVFLCQGRNATPLSATPASKSSKKFVKQFQKKNVKSCLAKRAMMYLEKNASLSPTNNAKLSRRKSVQPFQKQHVNLSHVKNAYLSLTRAVNLYQD